MVPSSNSQDMASERAIVRNVSLPRFVKTKFKLVGTFLLKFLPRNECR
jgi:hypothetical protein